MNVCECGRKYVPTNAGVGAVMCRSCKANRKRWQLKLKCLEILGGKCEECGYDRCSDALDFHHRDPRTKSFNISGRLSKGWSKIEAEVKKCKLLCSNCHREEHWRAKQNKKFLTASIPYIRPKAKKMEGATAKRIIWPDINQLYSLAEQYGYEKTAQMFNATGNAVKKRLKKFGMVLPRYHAQSKY